jgi:acyl carrier protein
MGLDTVELLMELEDEFRLSVPDADAERLSTVGATEDYIIARLRERAVSEVAGCPTAHRFYSLRRELLAHFPLGHKEVRPDQRIGTILPRNRWRREWPAVARAVGLPVPRRTLIAARFPEGDVTIRELVRQSFDTPYHGPDGDVNEEAVRRLVRQAVAEQAGVTVEDLHPTTRYVQDLGLD